MSRLSIFTPQWIDLVFENRNKEYGAYQLRQENPRTMLFSLLVAVAFTLSAYTIFAVVSHFNPEIAVNIPAVIDDELLVTDVIFPPKEKLEKATIPPIKKTTAAQPTIKNISKPVVTSKPDETADVPKNSDVTNVSNGTAGATTPSSGPASQGSPAVVEPEKPSYGNEAFGAGELDKNPEYPGGIKKFLSYVATNFKADEEIDSTIRVIVSFVVEKDGTMSNIMVKNNPGYGMGEEAIRVLKSMKTKWEPGVKDKQKVRAYYNLPILIQL